MLADSGQPVNSADLRLAERTGLAQSRTRVNLSAGAMSGNPVHGAAADRNP